MLGLVNYCYSFPKLTGQRGEYRQGDDGAVVGDPVNYQLWYTVNHLLIGTFHFMVALYIILQLYFIE